jgi:hypothetical protein
MPEEPSRGGQARKKRKKKSVHYRKQGKISQLQPRNLFTKPATIRYIRWLTKEYPDEYKGDEYNLIYLLVPMNIITYISRFHVTDERIGELTWQYAATTWLLYSSVNRRIYWPRDIYIRRLTEECWPRGSGPGRRVADRFVG